MIDEAAEEAALLNGLRDIADGDVRHELMSLMHELVRFVRDPRCPQAQGDGVPCTTVSLACEECQQTLNLLIALRRGISAVPDA